MVSTTIPVQRGNHVLAVLTAVYNIFLFIIQVFLGTIIGLLSGGLNTLSTAVTEAGGTIEGSVDEATTLTGLWAILLLVIGIGMLLSAIGIFMRRPWGWMLTIGVHLGYVIITLLSGALSGGIIPMVSAAISAAIVAAFFFIPDIKRALNAA